MRQFNLPRKLVSTVHMWVSVGLILLAFIFSLTPIITVETPEIAADIAGFVDEMGVEVDEDFLEQLEEGEIKLSSPKIMSSIGLIFKMVGAVDNPEKAKDFQEYLESDEGRDAVITSASLAVSLTNIFGNTKGSEGFISVIFTVVVALIGFLAFFIIALILPFIFFFKALFAVINALKNIKTPEAVSAKVGASLPGMIALPLTFMLFQCVVPGMSYAFGIVMITVLSILSVVVNFLASRTREYPAPQFRYLNVLQGGALVAIIGFVVFFFSIINSGIFNGFIKGGFLEKLAVAIAAESDDVTSLAIKGLLMMVYLGVVLNCTNYLGKAARRLSCTVKRERPKGIIGWFSSGKIKDNNIVLACSLLLAYILPLVVGDEYLGKYDSGKLTGALVGIIIMILAEVAVIVLKGKFCSDLSEQEMETLMVGQAMTSAEQLAQAEAIVAKAHEAEAAEAPAEAVSGEDKEA